ncbi:YncE family protein [Cellulophaga sp. HaHaR_3_176]|uniref:YncE family protein n=1 Tax=Cellulophaga sp. HaHaR_3_176 TaxID=1942464 RepID=UPI001C1FE4E8|nr:DUF5074 domain-containing protein [Cellulophaga sp. HaHaR_3_176]QWX82621.1 YncE family protein [Cellulophaga sp. HaHaR_3_176]
MRIKHVLTIIALGVLGASCSDDNDDFKLPEGDYANGILVSNEGPFSNGTGTVSFIHNDSTDVKASIYNAVNNEDLGNIVQSISFTNEKAYIIANVSNKITVVDRYTFVKEAAIETGLNNPRYMVVANGKGYVTNWGDTADETDDYIAIVNLDTNSIEGTIAVVLGPENIVASGDKVFVAHQGAYGFNNKISVIDTKTQEVETTITVGDLPSGMKFDGSGNLWVLSSGKPDYSNDETAGSIAKIDVNSNEVISSIEFGATEHPGRLNFDSNKLYYTLAGGLYELQTSAESLPTTPIMTDAYFYGMVIKDGKLYGTDAKDFSSNGDLNIYDLDSKALLNTFTVGIIPGGIYFN